MEDIKNLLELTDDELLEQLGKELWTESAHAAPATKPSLISEAKDWLKLNLPTAKKAVCENPTVKAIRQKADTGIATIYWRNFQAANLLNLLPLTGGKKIGRFNNILILTT